MIFLDQSNRRFRVEFVKSPELTALFVAERFSGRETLSRDFHFEVDLLSEQRDIEPDDVRGQMMIVWLRLPGGSERPFTGLVKHFEYVDSAPRKLHLYRVRLVPWLDYARLRTNCRVYREQRREDQVREILADYRGVAKLDWQITDSQRTYAMCVQLNESDYNYLAFRLEHDGAITSFRHDGKGHTWVVCSTTRDAEPIDGPSPVVEFHADDGSGISTEQYSITRWSRHSEWGAGVKQVSGYDFKAGKPAEASVRTIDDSPDVLPLQSHEFVGNYGFTNSDDAQRLARLRMQEIEVRRRMVKGRSTNPYLAVGRWFRLAGHPSCSFTPEDNDYVVNDIEYEARNNFLHDPDNPATFACRFTAHPRKTVWRPGRGWNSTPNVVTGFMTALVVGRSGIGPIDVDEYGRVLVRFHWDLEGRHTCRVRVQRPWQGGELGATFTPRIGSEVNVGFEMGNPDSPLVLGSLNNYDRMPAWRLPSQSAVSGFRTREATPKGGNRPGSAGNHLLFDDTPGKLSFQAFSSHLYSQISLGCFGFYDGARGRTRLRGQGIDLHTDGHGSQRAAKGWLHTTDARPNADSHATDIREAAQRLTNAQGLHQSLSDAAQAANAQDANDQPPVVQVLRKQTDELKGSGGDPERGLFPEFEAPHILTSSAAGVQSVAEGSTHIASNEHTALTSGGHTSISSGKSFLASVKSAIRLFAARAGMKLVAAAGDIDLTTLKNSINLLAKLNITLTADAIQIAAKTKVEINGGGSTTTWEAGGITSSTSGAWVEKASSFSMSGGSSAPVPNIDLRGLYRAQYVLQSQQDGSPLALHAYEIKLASGSTVVARTNTQGETVEMFSGKAEDLGLRVPEVKEMPQRPWFLAGGDSPIHADHRDD